MRKILIFGPLDESDIKLQSIVGQQDIKEINTCVNQQEIHQEVSKETTGVIVFIGQMTPSSVKSLKAKNENQQRYQVR